MKESLNGSPLHLPLQNIFSESFAKTATENGYSTLQEILAIPLTRLVHMDWFTTAMFEELSIVVKRISANQKIK